MFYFVLNSQFDSMASKLYGVNATMIIFVLVLYCIQSLVSSLLEYFLLKMAASDRLYSRQCERVYFLKFVYRINFFATPRLVVFIYYFGFAKACTAVTLIFFM